MRNLKCDTNVLIHDTETDSDTESRLYLPAGAARGHWRGWDCALGWAECKPPTGMDRRGPAAHREPDSASCDKPYFGKEDEKNDINV